MFGLFRRDSRENHTQTQIHLFAAMRALPSGDMPPTVGLERGVGDETSEALLGRWVEREIHPPGLGAAFKE